LQPRIAVSYQVSIIIFPGRAGTYEFTLVQTVERYITWNEGLWYTWEDEGKNKELYSVDYFKQRLLTFSE